MATTANYGWSTPDDTSLVKDGASAIRTLGSSIDTTVFNNANAAIAKTIVDAKADLITATAADTPARLAVGSDGQILTADSSTSTGLKWAAASSGAYTLISTTTMSGATTSLTSIPTTYKDLLIIIQSWQPATNAAQLLMRFNQDSTASRHFSTTSNTSAAAFNSTSSLVLNEGRNTNTKSLIKIYLPDYANTTTYKIAIMEGLSEDPNTAGYANFTRSFGGYNQTSAITSLDFLNSPGNFTAGTILLYGVK